MLLAFFGLGPVELIAIVFFHVILVGVAVLIGTLIAHAVDSSAAKRREFEPFDDDDGKDETAIRPRKP